MDTQQAQQLAEEAVHLVERLTAAWFDAAYAFDTDRLMRLRDVRKVAMKRWERRLDKWASAAYGPGVTA